MNREGPIKLACSELLAVLRRQGMLDFWYNHTTGLFKNGTWTKRSSKYDRNGVADICCILFKGPSVWIEVKAGKNKQSEEQIKFQKAVEAMGHEYLLVYSPRDIVAGMKEIFERRGIRQNII